MTSMLMPAMMKSERRRWLRWGGASAEMAVVATSKATDREDEEESVYRTSRSNKEDVIQGKKG